MAITREDMVDAALAQAERTSWEAVRLHDVAAALSVTLNDVRAHFREKEEIVDAWFDRADAAMLDDAARADCVALSSRQRIERLLTVWLAALALHRRVTREMVWNKLEPGHLHYHLRGLLRVSRTVQWLREAAGRDAVLPWRAIEEIALTGLYLGTFLYWMYDDSPDSQDTRRFLARQLDRAGRGARMIPTSSR
jgi:ubiquinone biosynthesis protein COQ9